jgi:hypothetical protein
MMGYEEIWKVLDSLLTDLKQRGEVIPAEVMKDLHSAKTMIQILKADPGHAENIPKVEIYLENVEFHLVSMAQGRFGQRYVERWMKKIEEARKEASEKRVTSRFIPGIPKGKDWVRVQVTKETPRKDIEKLAERIKLSHKIQEDGYILVWGKGRKVKSFIANLRKAQNTSKSSHPKRER